MEKMNKPKKEYPIEWKIALTMSFIGAFVSINIVDIVRGAVVLLIVSVFGIVWLPGKDFWKEILSFRN